MCLKESESEREKERQLCNFWDLDKNKQKTKKVPKTKQKKKENVNFTSMEGQKTDPDFQLEYFILSCSTLALGKKTLWSVSL